VRQLTCVAARTLCFCHNLPSPSWPLNDVAIVRIDANSCVRLMKLFQQMLLAPAALGLCKPMAANGNQELNMTASNRYADSQEQVTQHHPVHDSSPPMAYQALSNL